MPKEVDHDERRDEILTAVAGLLADVGLRGLTIRSLAARLGGSVSVVTHYFPTRHSLLVNIGPWILKKWQARDRVPDQLATAIGWPSCTRSLPG